MKGQTRGCNGRRGNSLEEEQDKSKKGVCVESREVGQKSLIRIFQLNNTLIYLHIECLENFGLKKSHHYQEDKAISIIIQQQPTLRWRQVSHQLDLMVPGSKRNNKQCRERWHNHLAPSLRKNQWSEVQNQIICFLLGSIGGKWSEISRHLTFRSPKAIKNHFNQAQRKGFKWLKQHFTMLGKSKIQYLNFRHKFKQIFKQEFSLDCAQSYSAYLKKIMVKTHAALFRLGALVVGYDKAACQQTLLQFTLLNQIITNKNIEKLQHPQIQMFGEKLIKLQSQPETQSVPKAFVEPIMIDCHHDYLWTFPIAFFNYS